MSVAVSSKNRSVDFERTTAKWLLSRGQKLLLLAILLAVALELLTAGFHETLKIGICYLVIPFFCLFVAEKLILWAASSRYQIPTLALPGRFDIDLPTYSILVPLYKEAQMLPGLIKAIQALRYNKSRLQVLLIFEEDDDESIIVAVDKMKLPDYFEIIIVPNVGPRTKPKACDYALQYVTGNFCVIYDAEDEPDPDQLLIAVARFRAGGGNIACLQAKLEFSNDKSSWIARFYWGEYIIHFNWILPGFAKLGLVPPLGGTSNHFYTNALREIAIRRRDLPEGINLIGAWDPYNVTEDADVAGWLARLHYKVEIINSTTYEEASRRFKDANGQRRRWLKGYTQTGLVHTRSPIKSMRQMGVWNYLLFNLMMLGTPLSLILNPLSWVLTFTYFGIYLIGGNKSEYISTLFTPWAFYAGIVVMVVGNLLLIYQLIIACLYKQKHVHAKHMLRTPQWWLGTSWSAYTMLFELIRPSTRHSWTKTTHVPDPKREHVQPSKVA